MADWPIVEGIWQEVRAPAGASDAPALFLDRDGVVTEEVGYLHRPEDLRLIAGAATALGNLTRAAWRLVLVTNQSGIGRGLYGWSEFAATQEALARELASAGATLEMVLACPFHPEGRSPYRHPAHPFRKPRPGMIQAACKQLSLDPGRAWIVGDRIIDLEAGAAAGLAGGFLVRTGYGAEEAPLAGDRLEGRFDYWLEDDLASVAARLLTNVPTS